MPDSVLFCCEILIKLTKLEFIVLLLIIKLMFACSLFLPNFVTSNIIFFSSFAFKNTNVLFGEKPQVADLIFNSAEPLQLFECKVTTTRIVLLSCSTTLTFHKEILNSQIGF